MRRHERGQHKLLSARHVAAARASSLRPPHPPNFDRRLIPQLLTAAQANKPAMTVTVTASIAQSSIRVVTDTSIPIVLMSVLDPVVAQIRRDAQIGRPVNEGGDGAMREGLTGIDHVAVLVRDLDAVERAWRRLGFGLPPRGHDTLGLAAYAGAVRDGDEADSPFGFSRPGSPGCG